MAILIVRLFVLTINQSEAWSKEAEDQSVETLYTPGVRGNIYDRNGQILATNKQIFSVNFNASNLTTEEINSSVYLLIKELERNDDEYVDNFPIKMSQKGNLYYSFSNSIKKWLRSHDMATTLSAEDAFNALRTKYKVPNSYDRFEAYKYLQDKYEISPPISVSVMKYTYDQALDNFLSLYGYTAEEIAKGVKAKDCFAKIRQDYSIDPSLSDDEARKIFAVRYEIKNNSFMKYMPISVATDVSDKTVVYIEEYSKKLKGVKVFSETKRYYPNRNLASHILGYMGSISEEDLEEYVTEKGYSSSALIGKAGIEAAYEDELRSYDGSETILVNSAGEYVKTIRTSEPKKGNDIYLTIDADLQKEVESTLENIVKATRTGTVFNGDYVNLKAQQSVKCGSGAAVVLDVKTGETLAMASYPDYNPNIFAGGISTKAWESVQAENPNDSLSPTPLYSLATNASVQPGSTFKPVTAMTALKKGLDPNRYIYDGRYVEIGDMRFGCDLYNTNGGSHGSETLALGIGNSCNFYFYCIGTGVDYNNNSSLGYKITNDDIMDTAKLLGLGDSTGIEIPEVVSKLASEKNKKASMKASLFNYIYNKAYTYFPVEVADDYDELCKNISIICDWIDENPSRDEMYERMKKETKVFKSKLWTLVDVAKYSYFNQASWTIGDSFNLSIGQGDNAYTPLQMARYISAIGNNGKINTVNIVKSVEGKGLTKKAKAKDSGVNTSDLKYVLAGMRNVTTMGTLSSVFKGFEIDVAGKTGTAEKQGVIPPKDEVEYVKARVSRWGLSWSSVEKWMKKLQRQAPKVYTNDQNTVDAAVIKASRGKVTYGMINADKDTYEAFAWTVALAPADNPQIAVVVMLPQGAKSYNAGIAAREIIGDYLLNKESNYNKIEKQETTID